MKNEYDIKLVDGWIPPSGDDIRPLIAMPNIPKPLHGVNPRTLLGASTWDHMRRRCYAKANNTCEICGNRPDDLYHRHAHEVYEINYARGTAKFVQVVCVCSLCHLACIHTGRALTLWKKKNPLYPTSFLLQGAEHAFKIISEYNKDNPSADLRAYSTFLDYLKHEELREPMKELIKRYNIKFYTEVEDMVEWKDWKLIIGTQEYKTPYASKEEWAATMEEREKKDSARIMQKNLEKNFTGDVYEQVKQILEKENPMGSLPPGLLSHPLDSIVQEVMKAANKNHEQAISKEEKCKDKKSI